LEADMDQGKALNTLHETLDALAQDAFTEKELERIRNRWLTDWSQTYASPTSLAAALSETVADGDWRLFFLQRDQVEQMKLEDVQRVTAAYLTPSNRTSGLYIPTDKPVRAPQTGASQLEALLKDYKGKDTAQVVDAFDPSP